MLASLFLNISLIVLDKHKDAVTQISLSTNAEYLGISPFL